MAKDKTDSAAPGGAGKVAALAAEITKALPGDPGPGPGEGSQGADGLTQEELARVYSADEVKDLVTLPAETMYALTGHERWILAEREIKILSEKGARMLSLIMKIEPKWFIVGSFFGALGSVYGTRAIAEIKERRTKKGTPQEG